MYETGKTYGNGLLKVDSLKLLSPSISGNQAAAKFEIVLHKKSRGVTGYKKLKKEFDLTLELDTANSNRLLGCVSDLSSEGDAVKNDVMAEICTKIGGSYDHNTNTCDRPMPRSLAGQGCTGNKVVVGFHSSGLPRCVSPAAASNPTNVNCPNSGEVLAGFGVSGNPICVAKMGKPIAACNDNHVLGFDSSNNPVCVAKSSLGSSGGVTLPNNCGASHVLGFDSGNNPVCIAKSSLGGGGTGVKVKVKTCATGEAVTEIKSNGDVVCTAMSSTGSGQHPAGYNCFLKHKLRILSNYYNVVAKTNGANDNVVLDDGTPTGKIRDKIWSAHLAGYNNPTDMARRNQVLNGISCPSGYFRRFRNDYTKKLGSAYHILAVYCCK